MISRRSFVSAAGAAGGVLGGSTLSAESGMSVAPAVSPVVSEFLDFDDPVEEFRAHMRMERDLVEEQGTTLTWYHWIVFMIPGGRRPEPLLRYEGIEYSYFRHLGNNNYRIHAHNLSYPRDLKTNKFTDSVINPITEKRVEVPVSLLLNDPGTIGSPAGFRNMNGGGYTQDVFRQFRVENDLIKLDSVRSAPPDWPATHIENSCQWVEFDLFANQSITSLPVHFCGHYAYEYPKWLGMPEGKGHLSGFWDGKKVNSPAELPREMLNRMEREYPELLKPRWDEFDRPILFEV
ncbi:MAG: twin-arginine translocation signal domain-containing protein [Pseudomonadota bacterium]